MASRGPKHPNIVPLSFEIFLVFLHRKVATHSDSYEVVTAPWLSGTELSQNPPIWASAFPSLSPRFYVCVVGTLSQLPILA